MFYADEGRCLWFGCVKFKFNSYSTTSISGVFEAFNFPTALYFLLAITFLLEGRMDGASPTCSTCFIFLLFFFFSMMMMDE